MYAASLCIVSLLLLTTSVDARPDKPSHHHGNPFTLPYTCFEKNRRCTKQIEQGTVLQRHAATAPSTGARRVPSTTAVDWHSRANSTPTVRVDIDRTLRQSQCRVFAEALFARSDVVSFCCTKQRDVEEKNGKTPIHKQCMEGHFS